MKGLGHRSNRACVKGGFVFQENCFRVPGPGFGVTSEPLLYIGQHESWHRWGERGGTKARVLRGSASSAACSVPFASSI